MSWWKIAICWFLLDVIILCLWALWRDYCDQQHQAECRWWLERILEREYECQQTEKRESSSAR
jgi:hypothetical protein